MSARPTLQDENDDRILHTDNRRESFDTSAESIEDYSEVPLNSIASIVLDQSNENDEPPVPTIKTTGCGTQPPRSNKEYFKKEYWDDRFSTEQVNNWLVTYEDVRDQLSPFLSPEFKILVVGCGNSTFSEELYDAGYRNLWNIDYSEVVIEAMRIKYKESRPEMKWMVMDMTNMSAIEDGSIDVVLDKAAMDALMSNEGDVWHPDASVVRLVHDMCRHISRVLVQPSHSENTSGGHHLQISFAQPHFRKKYLLGWHYWEYAANTNNSTSSSNPDEACMSKERQLQREDYSFEYGWTFRSEAIQKERGCFHHFLYIMTKSRPPKGH